MKKFDAYPRALEDFRIKTGSGGLVSIIFGVIMLWLFISEFYLYMSEDFVTVVKVDGDRNEKIDIYFDITFHKMPCEFISLDAMDSAGSHQEDVHHNIQEIRIKDGRTLSRAEIQGLARDESETDLKELPEDYCGNCYGAETKPRQCCNTCDDVREAYKNRGWAFANAKGIEQCVREGLMESLEKMKGEGCHMIGSLTVNKINGNFHIAPGRTLQKNHMHVHDMQLYDFGNGFDMSHTINGLSFGETDSLIEYPLDGVTKTWEGEGSSLYEYFLKVVPTTLENGEIQTNQFSVTEFERSDSDHPGVFFNYQIAPIRMAFEPRTRSFTHFLTGICAIIGGIFTISSLLDSILFHSLQSVQAKVDLGKFE